MGSVQIEKVVIRGLPIDTPEEEIAEDLTKLGFEVLKVTQFMKRASRPIIGATYEQVQKRKRPLFQIQLLKTAKFIKSLLYDAYA